MRATKARVTPAQNNIPTIISTQVWPNLSLRIQKSKRLFGRFGVCWVITLCISCLILLIYCACFHDSYLTLAASYHTKIEYTVTIIVSSLSHHSMSITIIKRLLVKVLWAEGIPPDTKNERKLVRLPLHASINILIPWASKATINGNR